MTIQNKEYRLPAEWEKQDAIQLTWPHAATDWHPYLADIVKTYVELVQAISRYEQVVIATIDPEQTRQSLARAIDGQQLHNIRLLPCVNNDTWTRDHGPIVLTATTPHARHILLDFKFNGWGEKFPWKKDNAITRKLYMQDLYDCEYEDHTDFVLEGGSIESDGMGTVLTSSQCLLAPHRNQPLTQLQIETRLKQTLHANRILWVDYGNLVGDDTDGHIDTIVRMAPDNTLLYMAPGNNNDAQDADLKAMERQLRNLRTRDGSPYRLLPLPSPRPIYDGPDRLPATYANFVIINHAVIVPTYAQPDLDDQAKSIIQEAFPDRDIIGIDARTVIRQHGSLHCLTMQLPEGTLKQYPTPTI